MTLIHPIELAEKVKEWLPAVGWQDREANSLVLTEWIPFGMSMIRTFPRLFLISMLSLSTLHAKDDAPRGFAPIAELAKASAEAIEEKRLLVLVVKGTDDACPNCATTLDNGERAIGSGVVKVFARAEAMNKADLSGYPAALKERAAKKFTTGASVTFLVFNPEGTQLLAEASRKELQSDKKAISAFKKEVAAHKRALK